MEKIMPNFNFTFLKAYLNITWSSYEKNSNKILILIFKKFI